jgi:hypothetical protein
VCCQLFECPGKPLDSEKGKGNENIQRDDEKCRGNLVVDPLPVHVCFFSRYDSSMDPFLPSLPVINFDERSLPGERAAVPIDQSAEMAEVAISIRTIAV